MKKLWIFLFAIFLNGSMTVMADKQMNTYSTAVLAGGCFWCVEHDLLPLKGVIDVKSGYAGGHVDNPTYEQVSAGGTGHVEAVEVVYDPKVISYEDLLNFFWHKIDPVDAGGQFCDRGSQYRSVVFYKTDDEKEMATQLKSKLSKELDQTVVTDVLPFVNFYPAEDYHQKYSEKNPVRYKFYRWNCGRDQRVEKVWGLS